jgi:tryptophan synthase beta chain
MSTHERNSKFGEYGGQYVPEVLMPAIEELADAYERYVLNNEDGFMDEFRRRLREFGGRPTPLGYAEQLSERYDTDVYLKRRTCPRALLSLCAPPWSRSSRLRYTSRS